MADIKICGLTRLEDARAAEAAGATYGGVILADGSPRRVHAAEVVRIFDGVALHRCGVFVNADFATISAAFDEMALEVVQLHGDEGPEFARRLREELGVETWKALRPRSGEEFAREMEQFAGEVDGVLLDGWSKTARGGTGTPFPWADVASRRNELPDDLRFVAAGGLGPANVAEMMELLSPDVVDVSSGVERAPGLKDHTLIHEFAAAVRSATARKE